MGISQRINPLKIPSISPIFYLHSYPIGSMYAIYGNIYHQYTPNVSIYTIHGSYGYDIHVESPFYVWLFPATRLNHRVHVRCGSARWKRASAGQ